MSITLSIFGLIILLAPTIFEIIRDRHGDAHPNSDWKLRTTFCIISGGVFTLVMLPSDTTLNHALLNFIRFIVVSGCLFTGIFNYWINYVHLKNGVTEAKVKIKNSLFNSPMTGTSKPLMFIDGVADYFECSKKEVLIHVLSHLSDSAWPDKTWWWRAIGWQGRLIVNTVILIGGLYLYFM